MTKPTVPTMMRQGLRLYQIHEMQLPGVTSILNSLAKPQLQYWAANTVAQCAIDELGKVAEERLQFKPTPVEAPPAKVGSTNVR